MPQSAPGGFKTGAPGTKKNTTKSQKMRSRRQKKKKQRPNAVKLDPPGPQNDDYTQYRQKSHFPLLSKNLEKRHPKSTQNQLNAVPDACVKHAKKTLLKSAATRAPRVPKLTPKMITKSSKMPSRAPLGHRGVSWGQVFWILAPF